MNSSRISARPTTLRDEPFLKELFFEIRSPEFAPAHLSPGHLQVLLDGQYEARKQYYSEVFPEAAYSVLEVGNRPVGCDILEDEHELHLIDIALSRQFQNQGLGTERLRQLMDRAAVEGKPIVLSVEMFNPARQLYERLGFEPTQEFGIYQRMRWNCYAQKLST